MSIPDRTAVDALPAIVSQQVYPSKDRKDTLERSESSSSSSSSSDLSEGTVPRTSRGRPQRPKLATRKSSGTIVISRGSMEVEPAAEQYDEDDPRMMSPRRTTEEIERLSEDARQAMIDQAKALQASLLDLVDRVETVRSEHEKLEGGNRFLQSYIGELMQTSKITAAGASKGKGKGKGRAHR